jgi:glycosyltransferase involved in cell wall biosynthesis
VTGCRCGIDVSGLRPRVSILVNLYNGARYLREALDSVMAQTFTDWELVLWDDQSTDGTAAIVAEYQDPRVRYYLSPTRTHLGDARRAVMQQARGEWLAFLDQDDIWVADKLARQMALADASPEAGLIYGRTLLFTSSGQFRDFDHRHEFEPLPEGHIFLTLFVDSCFIAISSAVFRRSVIRDLGQIPENITMTTDYYLFLAVAEKHFVRAVQNVVCHYRWHDLNMTHRHGERVHEEALWMVERWAYRLPAAVVERRRSLHHSMVAFYLVRHGAWGQGLRHLWTEGSPIFLLSRPFARALRAVRRRVACPYYRQAAREEAKPPTVTAEQAGLPDSQAT